jgi:hypothetical protein
MITGADATAERIVLVLRQSPDWSALAADYARGLDIDAARYVPRHHVPDFPGHIEQCVARWNATYGVDFFACRAELRAIARATLDAVAGGLLLTRDELPLRLPNGDFRLFFLDDDDWFAPDTAARMTGIGEEDVAVFPLLRLDAPVFTFARQYGPSSQVVGRVSRFSNRYHTNNYALHPRLCTPDRLAAMADHHTASAEADRLGLTDVYYDVMVSATNKTPVSASVVTRIVEDEAKFRAHVGAFVTALRDLVLPPHALWMHDPIRRTIDLFVRVLG